MRGALAKLVARRDLSAAEMESAIGDLVDGRASPTQIGAFLAALTTKGETAEELVAAVRVLRERMVRVAVPAGRDAIDTCGTGGDGLGTFNVSTGAAIVAAAAGAVVAKHGNRAASGSVGGADVLEALGVAIDPGVEAVEKTLASCGIAFLFAPRFHPAVRSVAAARREVGFRTLFNLTGPLCNPAGVARQVIGVFSADWLLRVAEALRLLGTEHALVVHGDDGCDEISVSTETSVVELARGEIRSYRVAPEDFAVGRYPLEAVAGGDAAENAAILRRVLAGRSGACADAVALNAGAAIYVAGIAASLAGGVARAREVLASGEALAFLERWAAACGAEPVAAGATR